MSSAMDLARGAKAAEHSAAGRVADRAVTREAVRALKPALQPKVAQVLNPAASQLEGPHSSQDSNRAGLKLVVRAVDSNRVARSRAALVVVSNLAPSQASNPAANLVSRAVVRVQVRTVAGEGTSNWIWTHKKLRLGLDAFGA